MAGAGNRWGGRRGRQIRVAAATVLATTGIFLLVGRSYASAETIHLTISSNGPLLAPALSKTERADIVALSHNLAPGDSVTRYVYVTNPATNPTVTYTIASSSSGLLFEGGDAATVTVTPPPGDTLTPGQTVRVPVVVSFPLLAGNTYQATQGAVDLTVDFQQVPTGSTPHNPPPSHPSGTPSHPSNTNPKPPTNPLPIPKVAPPGGHTGGGGNVTIPKTGTSPLDLMAGVLLVLAGGLLVFPLSGRDRRESE